MHHQDHTMHSAYGMQERVYYQPIEKEIYILADHSKIRRRGNDDIKYGSCTYDRPVTLITDDHVNSVLIERLRRTGMEVIQVQV